MNASPFLDRHTQLWLFVATTLACFPHTLHHFWWLTLAALFCLGWRLWLWHQGLSLPSSWLKALLVCLAAGGMLLEYRTLFGREAGTALLFLLAALKLLELRTRRDAYALVFLCFFLLLAYFLMDQSLFTGAWMVLALVALVASLLAIHGADGRQVGRLLGRAAKLLLQALPFMLVMYILFPRIGNPLWSLPTDGLTARTGLSDQMAPGNISRLVQNSDIAFRVRFTGPIPPKQQLYWRGPVLDVFDGTTWRPDGYRGRRPQLLVEGEMTHYEITLEPHRQRWLLALDAPIRFPERAIVNSKLTALLPEPLMERQIYSFASFPNFTYNPQEDEAMLRSARQLPAVGSAKTRALAATWVSEGLSQGQLVDRAMQWFRQENYQYSLQPPTLGPDGIDEFLFTTRQGFCEHYAGAFTVLMRAAGLPARVVTGYQGGEINPVDGFLVVRQSDAHAWTEVWLEDRGWTRVDPTAAVSPQRIDAGISSALPNGATLPGLAGLGNRSWALALQYQWEALNNAWNQWVLGYNQQKQQNFLFNLGLENLHWTRLAGWLTGFCCAWLLVMLALAYRQAPRRDALGRQWHKALGHLAKKGISVQPGETPLALAARVADAQPALAASFSAVAEAYCQARFGPPPMDTAGFGRMVSRWMKQV